MNSRALERGFQRWSADTCTLQRTQTALKPSQIIFPRSLDLE